MKLYVLILAGGSGTRLWPISRQRTPKQVRALLDDQTLLQKTYTRLRKILPAENIFISTQESYSAEIMEQLPDLATDQLITESEPKDSGPAVCWAALNLARREPEAVMAIVGADAYIGNESEYQRLLLQAPDCLATSGAEGLLLGVKPTYPETGYGYIQLGQAQADGVFTVKRFVEKPDLATAQQYLKQGNFLWNCLHFFFRLSTLLEAYHQLAPDIYTATRLMLDARGHTQQAKIYASLSKISIDYAIMEKMNNLVALPAEIDWADVGHWRAVYEILQRTEPRLNIVRGKHVGLGSQHNLIYSGADRLIATIGLEDFTIVDTPDALLVCPLDQAQRVKELVKKLEEENLEGYR